MEQKNERADQIRLKDILDWKEIENCFSELHKLIHLSIAISDIEGNILVSSGWQEICLRFHGAHPETVKNCLANDVGPLPDLHSGAYRLYQCKNNLYHAVMPLLIEKKRLGNLYIGQFFLDEEPVDPDFYKKQAERYGFPVREYLTALKKVPVISRNKMKHIMAFVSKFSNLISLEGLKNLQLSRNIDEIKGLMNSLKSGEEKYRLLVENQTDLIVKTDLCGNILYASPSYCRLFGRTEEDLLGKPYAPLIYEEDLPAAEKAVQEMMSPPYVCLYEERSANGKKWIQWTGRAVVGDQGEILSLIRCGRDITEQKTLEKALLVSQSRQNAMVANISDVLIVFDKNLIIKYVSTNIEKLFGWDPQELIGRKVCGRVPGEDRQKALEMILCLKKENSFTKTGEFRYCTKSGTVKDIAVTAVDLTEDPNIRGVMINYRDITDYKKREQEIRFLSYRDVMTGLYNRTFFEEQLDQLDHSGPSPFSVIMGDVNGLKLINDGFGHVEGDKALKQIAKILLNSCRKSDIVCRIGGDEFCIFLPYTDHLLAQEVCRRIYKSCEETNRKTDGIINLSLSLGFETRTDGGEALPDIIKRAEAFMYRHKLLESRSAHGSLISAIKATMYEKSQETEMHAERIVSLTVSLGKKLGLDEERLNQLELLATLHDLGKMSINTQILNKRDKLTPGELLEVRKHPEAGYRIALASPDLVHIADYILCHHEHWDGSGYPQGLRGERIPFLSRIIAVVDAYDAMINDRAYRKALPKKFALDEIEKNAGLQFDPEVVQTFLSLIQ